MSAITKKMSLAVLVGMLAFSSGAIAQQKAPAFDGKKFFDEIAAKGFKSPAGFDAGKFFDDLEKRGYSSTNKLDGHKFFEEIASKGFSAPAGFDAKKFFEEQIKVGGQSYMPPMVEMKK